MEFLVDDLLLIIFANCRYSDLVSIKRVNKRYQKLIIQNYQSNPFLISIKKGNLFVKNKFMTLPMIPHIHSIYSEYKYFHKFVSKFNRRRNNLIFDTEYSPMDRDDYEYIDILKIKESYLKIYFINKMDSWMKFKISFEKNQIELLRIFKYLLDRIHVDYKWIKDRILDQEEYDSQDEEHNRLEYYLKHTPWYRK